MATSARAIIVGQKELMRTLRALPDKVRRRISLGAVRRGARPIARAAASKAPRRWGALASSIGARTKSYRRGAQTTIAVIGARTGFGGVQHGIKTDPSKYAHLVEKGTRPHLLPYLRIGAQIVKAWWRHPGARPQPFLRPAFESNVGGAFSLMAEYIRSKLKAVAKA